jgi:hypothetical protein
MKRIVVVVVLVAVFIAGLNGSAYARRDPDAPMIVGLAILGVGVIATGVILAMLSTDSDKTAPQPQPFMPMANSPFKREHSGDKIRSAIGCPQEPLTLTLLCW